MIIALCLIGIKAANPEIPLGDFGAGMGILAFFEGFAELLLLYKATD